MKWFKHFTNAHNSKDLTKVRMRYGAEGYAIYWYCLELIAGDLGSTEIITFELKHDAEVIGYNLKIDAKRVEEIMRYMVDLELFENAEGTITCLKIAKYLDKKTTRNKTIHEIIDSTAKLDCPETSGTVPDKSGRSPLDTDTDTDISSLLRSEDMARLNQNALRAYQQHRKTIRAKKLKPKSEKAMIAWLIEQGDHNIQQAVVDQTIRNGWTGLFALKGENNEIDQRSRTKRVADKLDEIARRDIAENGFVENLD